MVNNDLLYNFIEVIGIIIKNLILIEKFVGTEI